MRAFALTLATCLSLGACQQVARFLEKGQPPAADVTDPGRKLVMLPAQAWALENCGSRPLPYLRLDQSEVIPKTVKRGHLIRYRFSYTACVPAQPGYILGRYQTTISFDGKKQSTRYDDGYPVETGKWIVDTHITVPKDADSGAYMLEATLASKEGALQDCVGFNVEP